MDWNRPALAAVVFSALSMAAFGATAAAPTGSAVARSERPATSARAGTQRHVIGTASNPPDFAAVDTNHDGVIERSEADAIGVPFGLLDIDGNGIITRSEYSVATAQHYAHG